MANSLLKNINHLDEFDYLRGFAILAVLAVHTSANFVNITEINSLLVANIVIDVFSHFAVPLFIFISGFVLSFKYKGLFSKRNFYLKRAKSIILPYIIFSTIYILFNIVLFAINGELKYPSIIATLFYFLTASSYYHLWFFALIIQFYIFYPYIIKLYEFFSESNRIFFFIFVVLIIQLAWIVISDSAITLITTNMYLNSIKYSKVILNIFFRDFFLFYVFYFIIGIYTHQNYKIVLDKIITVKRYIFLLIMIFTGIVAYLWLNGIAIYGSYNNIPSSYFTISDLVNSIYFI
jgi:surface polysaccharide O-acyltransferase-like enzyme